MLISRQQHSHSQSSSSSSKMTKSHQPKQQSTMSFIALCLLIITIGAQQQQQVTASGVFELNLASLVDSYGHDLRDDCCSWQNHTLAASNLQPSSHQAYPQQCDPTKCQLIIRICVKNYQTQIDPSQCTFGELSAQVMKPNEPAQYAHYPIQYASSLSRSQAAIMTNTANNYHQQLVSSSSASAANNNYLNPKRSTQHQNHSPHPTNIHHQRMLFQQQQQTPFLHQFASAQYTPPSALPPASYAPSVHYTHHHHSRYLPSSGQPRAMRTIAFNQPITFPFNFTWPVSIPLVLHVEEISSVKPIY